MQGNRVHPLQTPRPQVVGSYPPGMPPSHVVQKRLVWDNLTIAQAAPKLFICLCHPHPHTGTDTISARNL